MKKLTLHFLIRRLNVSLIHIKNLLQKNGYPLKNSDPDVIISDEQYNIICNYYNFDPVAEDNNRKQKEKSQEAKKQNIEEDKNKYISKEALQVLINENMESLRKARENIEKKKEENSNKKGFTNKQKVNEDNNKIIYISNRHKEKIYHIVKDYSNLEDYIKGNYNLLYEEYSKLWTETEILIREIIRIYVNFKFGENWEERLSFFWGDKESWRYAFENLIAIRESNNESFPLGGRDLLDYTMPRDYYNLFISVGFNDFFQNVLKHDKKYWEEAFDFLAEIRNPIAHNNHIIISKYQIQEATKYCNEIKKNIKEWWEYICW